MDLATFVQQHPFLTAFLAGMCATMRADYVQFKKYQMAEMLASKSDDEATIAALAKFSWRLAIPRWVEGGVTALTAALGGDSVLRNLPPGLI
jgi:hypothetical protein